MRLTIATSSEAIRFRLRVTIGLVLVGTGCGSVALAEEPQSSQSSQPDADEEARREIVRIAKQYQLFAGPDRRPLAMDEEPALRWPNPTRETRDGATFLWTLEGRPAAIACIWKHGVHSFAFQSLSDGPLVAEHGGSILWQPANSGMTFQPFAAAPEPASTPAKRLLQMKDLARRFHCRLVLNDGKKEELRLLPKPLYRYAPTRDDLLDGALFAFVQGTDPEVILLIEARRVGEHAAWNYAFTRRSMLPLEADLEDEPVWSVPLSIGSPNEPWFHGSVRPLSADVSPKP